MTLASICCQNTKNICQKKTFLRKRQQISRPPPPPRKRQSLFLGNFFFDVIPNPVYKIILVRNPYIVKCFLTYMVLLYYY